MPLMTGTRGNPKPSCGGTTYNDSHGLDWYIYWIRLPGEHSFSFLFDVCLLFAQSYISSILGSLVVNEHAPTREQR